MNSVYIRAPADGAAFEMTETPFNDRVSSISSLRSGTSTSIFPVQSISFLRCVDRRHGKDVRPTDRVAAGALIEVALFSTENKGRKDARLEQQLPPAAFLYLLVCCGGSSIRSRKFALRCSQRKFSRLAVRRRS